MLTLTEANYHSPEANLQYASASSYKNYLECEAMALASDRGEWVRETTPDCLAGSLLHSWSEGKLEEFKAKNPEIYSSKGPTKGELLAKYKDMTKLIDVLEKDSFCMYMLEGRKEVIMTAEFAGATWKIKMDVYKPEDSIVDLKSTKSIRELQWDPFFKCKMSFVEIYKYLLQAAIYKEIERRAQSRKIWLPFYIVAASKENYPDKAVISLEDDNRIKHELMLVEANMPRILAVKSGEAEPVRCEKCPYCRSTKTVTDIISYKDLEEKEAI